MKQTTRSDRRLQGAESPGTAVPGLSPGISLAYNFNMSDLPSNLDPRLQGFLRQLLHNAINMAMQSVMWRLPTFWLIAFLFGAIGAVILFGIY